MSNITTAANERQQDLSQKSVDRSKSGVQTERMSYGGANPLWLRDRFGYATDTMSRRLVIDRNEPERARQFSDLAASGNRPERLPDYVNDADPGRAVIVGCGLHGRF